MNDIMRRLWHGRLRAWAVDPRLADRTFEEIVGYYADALTWTNSWAGGAEK